MLLFQSTLQGVRNRLMPRRAEGEASAAEGEASALALDGGATVAVHLLAA
jgi:hypothetical protein